MDDSLTVGQRIAISRAALGWSQARLTDELQGRGLEHMHQTTVSRIERGSQEVRLLDAVTIADSLGVTLHYLAGVTAEGGPDIEAVRSEFLQVKRRVEKAMKILMPLTGERGA